jgi:[protein-PII] uridylyltransferase
MAQKRDLSDPRTVSDFAQVVKSPRRLNLLLVLTACDIRGVGPNVWNNWKAMLLRELYAQTLDHLTDGASSSGKKERVANAKGLLAAQLGDWKKSDLEAELVRHYDAYWIGLDITAHEVIAKMARKVTADSIQSNLQQDEMRDATRVAFVMQDHPGIFSRLAGALALVGANVVEARSYTSSDGLAITVLWVQDKDGKPYEVGRLPRLKGMITKTLKGEIRARDELKTKDKRKRRERDFIVPTSITFDNEGSDVYTLIEVDTRDRPGLLFDLTRTLAAEGVVIASAVIATYGEQAVDTFYCKDIFGLKIRSADKQAKLGAKLRDAIQSTSDVEKG